MANDNAPAKASLSDLLRVMADLRTPGTGCPWDLEQTFATIAPYTIEEAYEVADAITRHDLQDLKRELGDLLFQVVYHARMAEEAGAFTFADVVAAITEKMRHRHPHVFGTPEERAAGAKPGFWERIKADEQAGQAAKDLEASWPGARRSEPCVLEMVPLALPALTRAVKLQNKAAQVGFDWPSLAPVFKKLREELKELESVVRPSLADCHSAPDRSEIEEEFGDLLFVIANVARHLKLDPETALRGANEKFVRRFRFIEDQLASRGRSPSQSTLEEMDRLWDEAKARERN